MLYPGNLTLLGPSGNLWQSDLRVPLQESFFSTESPVLSYLLRLRYHLAVKCAGKRLIYSYRHLIQIESIWSTSIPSAFSIPMCHRMGEHTNTCKLFPLYGTLFFHSVLYLPRLFMVTSREHCTLPVSSLRLRTLFTSHTLHQIFIVCQWLRGKSSRIYTMCLKTLLLVSL